MSIQENIQKVEKLLNIIDEHLVGGKLTIGSNVTYIFNEQYSGLAGVRVSLDKGKINALTLLVNKIDELYNKEFSWNSHHTDIKSL